MYNAGDEATGNQSMRGADQLFRDSMTDCDKTNDYFTQMFDSADDFLKQDNWKDTAKANYVANKDFIDQQWQLSLSSWNTGVYFNSGMFYERVWLSMSGIAPIVPTATE